MDVETKKEAPLADKPPAGVLNSSETLVSDMEVETPPMEVSESEPVSKSPSVPCFLKRVMDVEKDEIKGNLGFLVVAVHAVFLESGFVACVGDGDASRLPKDWNLANSAAVSIQYTVPELLGGGEFEEINFKVASLKFSPVGNHVSVYGHLSGGHDIYRLHLDLAKVVPLLVFLSETVRREEEEEAFRFWKTVKDQLCLPLLIGICEKNGLPPPPCFARLPTDIKLKVLELLPGCDVARFGCTGSEMKYLASNDELWKQKFMEEFGHERESEVAMVSSWKEKFKRCWIRRRDVQKAMRGPRENRLRYPSAFRQRYPSAFAPQRFPFVGGDYDRFPVIGDMNPMGPGLGIPRFPARQVFPRQCNLGGRSDNFNE